MDSYSYLKFEHYRCPIHICQISETGIYKIRFMTFRVLSFWTLCWLWGLHFGRTFMLALQQQFLQRATQRPVEVFICVWVQMNTSRRTPAIKDQRPVKSHWAVKAAGSGWVWVILQQNQQKLHPLCFPHVVVCEKLTMLCHPPHQEVESISHYSLNPNWSVSKPYTV